MHDTALLSGKLFLDLYAKPGDKILDVGSMDVNGTLRPFAPKGSKYIGLDIAPGPGVDLVIKQSERDSWPLDIRNFDIVISTSCFEHDPNFWITFMEMVRVTKIGGYIYISAPANGPYHGYPVDCWRFYKDAARSLQYWAYYSKFPITVVENFELLPMQDQWIDQIMIFESGDFCTAREKTLADALKAEGARIQ